MQGVGGARLLIGDLATRTGCRVETVRYYERAGVMPAPARSSGGHRLYTLEHLKRLHFIRRCRDLGIGLDRTRELLALVDTGGNTCDEVRVIAEHHLDTIRGKIADLRRMERVMKDMVATCSTGAVPYCPIIDALYWE